MTNESEKSPARFSQRVEKFDETNKTYYHTLRDALLSQARMKSKTSERCETFKRYGKLVAKLAIGGSTLKLFLAIEPNDQLLTKMKIHAKDVSHTACYAGVPSMFQIKSGLAVRKLKALIDELSEQERI